MRTLKQIIENRSIELSRKPYTASRVTYNKEIVKIGPSAIAQCLRLIVDGSVQNPVIINELLASVVEIIENNKDEIMIREIMKKIGGQAVWDDHIGSEKFELILNWWPI